MTSNEIREKYLKFFEDRGHARIEPSPLVLKDDPTTLFTSSGMQQLVPYLKGEKSHPAGKRLVDSQPSFRAVDIDLVGDKSHTTFFEMLGNWSLGDYFKEEQLAWCWEFFTKELGLPKDKLWVSVFEGDGDVPKDEESAEVWKKLGVSEEKIRLYGVKENWWSRAGTPNEMPAGEIGGPDSEVFYEFDIPHDPKYGNECHPNCQCAKFLEIGNSVFIQYQKSKDGSLSELPQKNVDFGAGLERLTAARDKNSDIFRIDMFREARKKLEETHLSTEGERSIRVILDHVRASAFIINSGIEPSNKGQGYVLRRLIRRAALYSKMAHIILDDSILSLVLYEFGQAYSSVYPEIAKKRGKISSIISDELNRFEKTLEVGMRKILSLQKGTVISGAEMFDFYQTYGYPPELVKEFAQQHGVEVDTEGFEKAKLEHQEISRKTSSSMFKTK